MTGRILEISLTADPLNATDGGVVGGQQLLVRDMVRGLTAAGIGADVVTHRQLRRVNPSRRSLGHLSRVVRIGSEEDCPKTEIDWVAKAAGIAEGVVSWVKSQESEYNLVHSHFWVSGMVAQEVSQRLSIPWVHSPYKMAKWVHRSGEVLPARRVEIERSLLNEVSAVVANYLDEGELIHSDAPRTPLYMIPPAIDATQFFERDPGPVLKGLGLRRRPAVYVGRLSEARGLMALLKAMVKTELPSDFTLLVVGGGSDEVVRGRPVDPQLNLLKKQLGSQVKFLGSMPHGAVAQYLSAAQVVFAPNQGPTLGMAVVEALACARPVVGSRVTGISDWITPGVDGYLFPAEDVEAMLEQGLVLWQDSARARSMGRLGYEKVHRRHSLEYMTQQLLRVYEEVIDGERIETGASHGY